MTYGHLRADCLYSGISSGPNARYRVLESLYLYFLHTRARSVAHGNRASHAQAQRHDVQLPIHGQARSTCSTFANQSRRHLRSAGRPLLNVPHQKRSTFARRLSLWLVRCGVELVAGLSERPGSWQKRFLQAL